MFSRLPESRPTRQRRLGGAIVSTAVHLVFIALAVRATGLKAESAPRTYPLPPIYVPRTHEPSPEAAPRTRSSRPSTSTSPLPMPPRTLVPRIDLDVAGIPEPGAEITSLVRAGDFDPPSSVISNSGSGGSPNVSGGAPMPENLVDKPILAIPGTTTPRYPSMLQSAGIEGDVRAQFVVDTLGRVERGSVRILESSNDQFGLAVREALARARFKAAEAGGRKVRQLAEQVFTFRITR